MRATMLVVIALCLAVTLCVATWAQGDDEEKTVSIGVAETPAADIAAEITRQTGVKVAVTAKTDAVVSFNLTNTTVEEAVAALASSFDGSWMRGYMIRDPKSTATYTADQLAAMMQRMRDEWMRSLTDEQRQALTDRWRQVWQARREQEAAAAQGGQDQQAAQGQRGRGGPRLYDPIRQLLFPERSELVTFELADTPLKESLYMFMWTSGYICIAEPSLKGNVTAKFENTDLAEALDYIAEAAQGEWETVYLVSQPKELTEEERTQMFEAQIAKQLAEFWAKPPEERAKTIQDRVEMIQRMSQRGDRGGERGGRMMSRIMQRVNTYVSGLTADQRRELKPLTRALSQAAAARQQ